MGASLMTGAALPLVSWTRGPPLIGQTDLGLIPSPPMSAPPSPDVWSPEDSFVNTALRCDHRLVKTIILFTSNRGQSSVSTYERLSRMSAPVWQLLSPPDWVSLIVSQFVSDLCVALFLVSVTTINYQPSWLHKPVVIQSITESRECFMLQTLIIFTICFVSQSTFIFGNLEPELEPSNKASIYEYHAMRHLCMFIIRSLCFSDVTIFHPRHNF